MKLSHLAGAATVLFASIQIPQAVPITGNIGFTGGLTYNTSSSANATEVTSWIAPQVVLSSGVFAAPSLYAIAPGTAATFSSAIWSFNTSTPINAFWMVGGFTFELLSSFIAAQGGTPGVNAYVDVDGTGLVSGNGYAPTVMSFDLTSQDPMAGHDPDSWTFSASGASNTVADGGSTLMLLGLTLTGVALTARKLKLA